MQKKDSPYRVAATLLGIGNAPIAPGTVATLAAGVPAYIAIGSLGVPFQIVLSFLLVVVGCRVSTKTEIEMGKVDPCEVVIDELCGFLIAMIGHPVTFSSILTGFILFRLFDIWKPWPLRFCQENMSGGLGIMMDDVGAGIYANILGLLILKAFNLW